MSRKNPEGFWRCIAATTKHFSGNGYRYITRHKRATDLFAAWVLVIRLASRMPIRGLLVSDSGRPLSPEDMAEETRFPAELFEFALPEFCKPEIGWLEEVPL